MALISIIENFVPLNDDRLLRRAEELKPRLFHALHEPVRLRFGGEELGPERLPGLHLGRGEQLILDFGEHLVGYVSLGLAGFGSHPDAPAYLKLDFAERLQEWEEDAEAYDGWLSRSWIQEERLHADLLPCRLELPRRYAFRYLRLTVLDTSPKYRLSVEQAVCRSVSAADRSAVSLRKHGDALLDRLCAVSLHTLADCMQEVFEDGPKRDRRLWVGDLRLQALTNAVSFRNFDLVKRCLYLFAGSRFPDGRVSACVFTEPEPAADDTFLFDYALLYPVILEEYLQETGDEEALQDLYGAAMAQLSYGLAQLDGEGLVNEQAVKDSFIDWCDELDRQAAAQGVLIYALGYGVSLANRMGQGERAEQLLRRREELTRAAEKAFWSEEAGCFLSRGQFSAATQIWMALAGVGSPEQRRRAMDMALQHHGGPKMGTPYLHHYAVMALLSVGRKAEALAHMKAFWGGMLSAGADTFWECWDGEHPELSPYGGSAVNSYCHAWSCTPAWLIERFFSPEG